MKVLIDHPNPFLLAHGGFQTQIEGTKKGLQEIGLEVEWLRWWDADQTGDVIHYFGRPGTGYIDFAHRKGIKVVMSELLSGLGSRSAPARALQKFVMSAARLTLPGTFTSRMAWGAYESADACIAGTEWEAYLMKRMFNAPSERLFVVSNGVELEFFQSPPQPREDWLVCTATITERKRVLELATAAIQAKVPIWFIGRPYSESDPYFRKFIALAASTPSLIKYEGAVNDRSQLAKIYRRARGFVLLSTMESLSFSSLEAAACGNPLLLSDLPWAHSGFGSHARYCPASASTAETARILRTFYDEAPSISLPPKPSSWKEIAEQLAAIYRGQCKAQR